MDWRDRAASSPYLTAAAIDRAIKAGHLGEAEAGCRELIDALSRSERRALRSQLIRLKAHVIQWSVQPERRSHGGAATIVSARDEIRSIQEETPGLSDDVLRATWGDCVRLARVQVEGEMNRDAPAFALGWDEVLVAEYRP